MSKILSFILFFSAGCGYPEYYEPVDSMSDGISGIEIISADTLFAGDESPFHVLTLLADGSKAGADLKRVELSVSDDKVIEISGGLNIRGISEGEALISAVLDGHRTEKSLRVKNRPDYSLLFINEVFYDAAGADDGLEFIELINAGAEEIDLGGVQLIDGSLKSRSFIFPQGVSALPYEIMVVASSEDFFAGFFGFPPDWSILPFSLNNSGETVFLMCPEGVLLDEVYIEGGSADYPAPEEWGGINMLNAREGYSVKRICLSGGRDCWISGVPDPASGN